MIGCYDRNRTNDEKLMYFFVTKEFKIILDVSPLQINILCDFGASK
jgi:hypothetical protein